MKVLGDGEKRLTNGFGILEDIGDVPLDEIAAIGLGLSAAAATALLMIEAFNKINMSTDDRIKKAESDAQIANAILANTNMLLETFGNALALNIKESLMVGSVLPDKVG